jgi:hypothetical protein
MDINNILDGSKKKSGKSFSEEFKQKKDVNVDDSNHQHIKDNNTEYPEIKNNNDIVSEPPSDDNDTSDDNDPIYKVIKIIGVSIIVLLLIVIVINNITTKNSPSNEKLTINEQITQQDTASETVSYTDDAFNTTEQDAIAANEEHQDEIISTNETHEMATSTNNSQNELSVLIQKISDNKPFFGPNVHLDIITYDQNSNQVYMLFDSFENGEGDKMSNQETIEFVEYFIDLFPQKKILLNLMHQYGATLVGEVRDGDYLMGKGSKKM